MAAAGKTSWRGVSIAFFAVIVLLGALVAAMDGRQAWHLLKHARWDLVPLALLCTALSYFCLSAGYSALNRLFGIYMRRRDLLEIGFVSFAINNLISVGGLAGYSLRLLLMRRRGFAAGDIVGASLVHSYFNHVVMMSLLPLGLTYILFKHPLGHQQTAELSVAAALSIFLLVGTTVLLVAVRPRVVLVRFLSRLGRSVLRRDVEPTLRHLDTTLGRGVEAIRLHPAVLGIPLLFVICDWVTSVMALGFCFDALGDRIHTGVLLTGFAIGVSIGFLSMLPGGMGAQEGSMSGIFVLLGVPLEQAVLAALLFRVVYYIVPFAVSLVLYAHLLRRKPVVSVEGVPAAGMPAVAAAEGIERSEPS